MDAISYEYTKQRKQFGLHPVFGDSQPINQSIDPEPDTPELIDQSIDQSTNQFTPLSPLMDSDNLPPPKSSAQWMESINQSINLDCIPNQSMHSINTDPFVQKHQSINQLDGCWPIDVKHEYIDRQRYVRRLINEPTYQSTIPNLTKSAESIISINNTIDCYETYFPINQSVNQSINGNDEVMEEYSAKPPSAKTVCVFRDPNQSTNQSTNQSYNSTAKLNTSTNQPINQCRAATKISWHPECPTKLAVSYAVMAFQSTNQSTNQSSQTNHQSSNQSINQSTNPSMTHSYIWDLNAPNHPDAVLTPSSMLSCIAYNPRSPDQLIGGCVNGQLMYWDLRKGGQPIDQSIVEKSHHDPVYDVAWIQSRTGNEVVSLSTDGQLLWWDVRKIKKGHMDAMQLFDTSNNQSTNQSTNQPMLFGGCSMEYKSDAGATRFLIGTEQGVCILADRKAKKDAESTKSIKTMYGSINQSTNQSTSQSINASLPCNGAHYGPVNSIQRSPFNVKIFLTCGDWCAKIWMEDLREPIMMTRSINQPINQSINQSINSVTQQAQQTPQQQTRAANSLSSTQTLNQAQPINQSTSQSTNQSINQSNNSYITCCAWSPTRPGVFFLAKTDGSIDVYDLLRKCELPVYTQKVSDVEITSIKPSINGKYLAIGDSNGSVTILQLTRGLIDASANEKVFVSNLFEREAKREKALEVKKMQARKAPSTNQPTNPPINQSTVSNEVEHESAEIKEAIQRAEEDFWILIDSSKDAEETKEEQDPTTNQSTNQSNEEEKEETQMVEEEEKTNH